MNKIKTVITVATVFLLSVAGTSYAADTAAKQPLDQAIKSVDKNLAKDPDNKGLQNAAGRLQANKERHDEKRAERAAKRQDKKERHAERAERPEKTERPERAERPEPMGRPGR